MTTTNSISTGQTPARANTTSFSTLLRSLFSIQQYNISSDITGILNPASFGNLNVDLQPWFNGSIGSTYLNNQAVGVSWLGGRGLDPLYAYLNGSASSVMLIKTTNQYHSPLPNTTSSTD